jgi:hypothetical protein
MKNTIILAILFMLSAMSLQAQRRELLFGESSIEVSAGPTTLFLGDIGDPFLENYFYNADLQPINSSISIGFHQSIAERFGYKVSIHSNVYDRKDNNFSFRSNVFQVAARGEIKIFNSYYPRANSLYLYGGIGFLYSSYFKQKLATPIVNTISSTIAPVIPMGIGYRYEIFDRFSIGAEMDVNYAFTDMIEGKEGGMPHDALSTFSLIISYQISEGTNKIKNCNCNW